jgi:hypothetical protein
MNFLKHLSFLVLLSFFGTSEAQDLTEKTKSEIEGTWVWASTRDCGVKGAMPETPQSCKCSRKIVIHKNNKFEDYRDGKLAGTYTYSIRHKKVSAEREELYFESETLSGNLFATPRDLTISNCDTNGKHIRFKRTD